VFFLAVEKENMGENRGRWGNRSPTSPFTRTISTQAVVPVQGPVVPLLVLRRYGSNIATLESLLGSNFLER
jgi:hypothetical protein